MAKQGHDDKIAIILEMDTKGGKVPEWAQLCPFGEHRTLKGNFILDEAGAIAVLARYKSQVTDLVIDYEHQTLHDVIAPAAGWIGELENRGKDGLWASVAWCKKAAGMLAEREYRYLSPVLLMDKNRRVLGIHSAALTNTPDIDGMQPLVAKQDVTGGDAEKLKEERILMDKILTALGLAATATADEVVAAINAMKTGMQQVACKGLIAALGIPETAKESEAVATVLALKSGADQLTALGTRVTELTARNTELEGQAAETKADGLVLAAMKAGKIAPGQKDWAMAYAKKDASGFEMFVAKAAVVVDLGAPKEPAPAKTEAAELSEPELMACKQMGISEEDLKKHKKA